MLVPSAKMQTIHLYYLCVGTQRADGKVGGGEIQKQSAFPP